MATAFSLNPQIDAARIRAEFLKHDRVRVTDFLAAEDALRLHEHLSREIEWSLVRHDPRGRFEAPHAVRSHWGNDSEREFHEQSYRDVRESLRYLYEQQEVRSIASRTGPSPTLQSLAEFLNSTPVLALVRELTGADDIDATDVIATAYRKGHFLTRHMDGDRENRRRVAYVLNLTPVWYSEWGGHLQFLSAGGEGVCESYVPAFNRLALFKVPQLHAVSVVAPYAAEVRYSVTGWFRTN